MELGYFGMPSHPPEREIKEGWEFDLSVIRWLDELGYQEAWIGEHHTCRWEPLPAPDLLVAQAITQTKNIRLGPGGYCLPYHHPADIANRISILDHMSGGRLNFGAASGALPTDQAMFNIDGTRNREMTRESLDIILRLWNEEEPFVHEGKYWKVTKPAAQFDVLNPYLKPLQNPRPPIALAGLSRKSDTLKLCGERGYLPLSLNLSTSYIASHWDSVCEGAAISGRIPDRNDWRLVREVFVADTDKEAWELAVNGPMGRMMREYYLPLMKNFGCLDYFKNDPEMPDSDLTVEYLARNNWLIGSPETVARKLEDVWDTVGGFGVLCALGFDYVGQEKPWQNSFELLAKEVIPSLSHLNIGAEKTA
jgi:alkanesulfonate monooxygenase SsuD/methylene tetrahydromethanopterin reductase-like flavin-dependent oxidoreductase (luciferase family)